MTTSTATPGSATADHLQLPRLLQAEPDLVDRIFDYILSDPALAQAIQQSVLAEKNSVIKLKAAVRAEFRGEECYIAERPATVRQQQVSQVLTLFNGRNSTEVARRLGISRATVYRHIKQSGPAVKPSQFSGK